MNVSPEVRGRIQGVCPSCRRAPFSTASPRSITSSGTWTAWSCTSPRCARRRRGSSWSARFFDRLRYALDALGVSDTRYVIRPAPGSGLALVAGPPRFVTLVEQTLAGLIAEDQARPRTLRSPDAPRPPMPLLQESVLTVFRGSDTTIIRDGRPEHIAGLDDRRRTARTTDQ